MKKVDLAVVILFVLFVLFATCNAYSQKELSFRIDWNNALFGSDVNPRAFNWKIGFSDYYNGTYTRLGTEYESFDYIDYQQWTFMKIDQEIPVTKKLSILPGIAFSQIFHETTYSHDAMAYALNFEVTWVLNDFLKLSLQAERERATDIEQKWRDSAYGGLIYYWE